MRVGTVEMRLETGDSPPAGTKKPLDQTRVIPQGVKVDELEGSRPVGFDTTKAFSKKSNRATTWFIVAAIVIGLLLVGALFWVLTKPR